MCPIFVGSVDNFGRSDLPYIVKKCLFPLGPYVVSYPDCTKNLELYLSQVAIYAKLKEDERFLTSFKRSSGYVKLLAELDLLSNCTSKSDEDLDDEDETNSLSGKYYIISNYPIAL